MMMKMKMNVFGCLMATLMTGVTVLAGEVTMTDVTARQRYPWNGKVDIVVTLTGASNDVANAGCRFVASNSVTRAALNVSHVLGDSVASAGGSTWTRKFVWDATADLGEVNIADVALTVEAGEPFGGVQLWENGPYWAECNVGAMKPEEYGYYFSWGDTVGRMRSGGTYDSSRHRYTDVTWVSSTGTPISSYIFPTFHKTISELQSAGYIDSTGNLVAAYDAATAHLGAPWRMPTDAEFSALISNCDSTLMTRNGVYGRLVTGRGAYASRSIFLPAAGYGDGFTLQWPGSDGFYLSSTSYSGFSDNGAWELALNDFDLYGSVRSYGHSVRPVRGFAK